jgi:hypothetical protein
MKQQQTNSQQLTPEVEEALRVLARNFIQRVIEEHKGPLKNASIALKSKKEEYK